jgi:hypothetical protein
MHVVDPDLSEDMVGLDRARQTAEAIVKQGDFLVETLQHLLQ